MPLQLALAQHNGTVTEHTLYEQRDYRIGRANTADVVIANPQVSRCHAVLKVDSANNWYYNDISSTGSYENGKALKSALIDRPRTLSVGPVPCRLTPVSASALLKQDSQHVWRKRQLTRYHQRINGCENTLALVNTVRECLIQTLHCERAAFILFDRHASFESSIGYQPWMDAESFTGSRTVISDCIESGQPLALGNIQQESAYNAQHSVVQYGIKAAICVPVKIEDDVIGVLYGDNTLGRVYFTETDTHFASSLAQFLSLRLLFQSIEHKISLAAGL